MPGGRLRKALPATSPSLRALSLSLATLQSPIHSITSSASLACNPNVSVNVLLTLLVDLLPFRAERSARFPLRLLRRFPLVLSPAVVHSVFSPSPPPVFVVSDSFLLRNSLRNFSNQSPFIGLTERDRAPDRTSGPCIDRRSSSRGTAQQTSPVVLGSKSPPATLEHEGSSERLAVLHSKKKEERKDTKG